MKLIVNQRGWILNRSLSVSKREKKKKKTLKNSHKNIPTFLFGSLSTRTGVGEGENCTLYKYIFTPMRSWLAPSFINILSYCKRSLGTVIKRSQAICLKCSPWAKSQNHEIYELPFSNSTWANAFFLSKIFFRSPTVNRKRSLPYCFSESVRKLSRNERNQRVETQHKNQATTELCTKTFAMLHQTILVEF